MTTRTDQYKVVINHEEQYSIVPINDALPRGVREVGRTGSSAECMKYIEEVWTDMTLTNKREILSRIEK